ncbi:hypothetical protein CHARACLAT_027857 [Characodon lateralis]|uniref:Uncharacterized protein n=1 Tax=Characodon lateralis TaxID=208331 RepID=A0ABU7DEB5_9TELE|nr:hypothetical protein [Characodon lateralis]
MKGAERNTRELGKMWEEKAVREGRLKSISQSELFFHQHNPHGFEEGDVHASILTRNVCSAQEGAAALCALRLQLFWCLQNQLRLSSEGNSSAQQTKTKRHCTKSQRLKGFSVKQKRSWCDKRKQHNPPRH